jgi:hypothetical protein
MLDEVDSTCLWMVIWVILGPIPLVLLHRLGLGGCLKYHKNMVIVHGLFFYWYNC